jgi:diaminopimelate epimerase
LIPYTKAHGSKNDFLLTWQHDAPSGDLVEISKAICNRYTGIGADGWLIVNPGADGKDAAIRLYNSDGSYSEMSGNGTRCAAAFLIENGKAADDLTIQTGAGPKHLRLLERFGHKFIFEMNMGPAAYREDEIRTALSTSAGAFDVTILNVGNPQCAVFVENFDFDWRKAGVASEWHERFPQRTNVSFVKVLNQHTIEVLFWERGAGETMSSGTGSTGAAFAAFLRGMVSSPFEVRTPAGSLHLSLSGDDMMVIGPAEIVSDGKYYGG